MVVFDLEGYFSLAVMLVLLVVKIVALVLCLLYPAAAYVAAGKLTKIGWTIILGLGLVVQVVTVGDGPVSLLNLVATVAAIVFLVDVRPAVTGLRRR